MPRPMSQSFTKAELDEISARTVEAWARRVVRAATAGDMGDFIVRTNSIEGYDVSPDDAGGALEAVAEGYPVSYATQDKHVLAQLRMLGALEKTPHIDTDAVREIHRAQGGAVLDNGVPGMWRSGGSRSSGGMKYAEPGQIPAAMAWWEKQEFESPFQKIAVLMQIHPFDDGNGRMGRMALLKLNDMDVGKTMGEIGDDYFKRLRSSVEDAGVDLENPPWKQEGGGDVGGGAWEAFLQQHYEGGRRQVRNPNPAPGAKETISVGYLLRHHPESAEAREIVRRYQMWQGGRVASHSNSRCMHDGCKKVPAVEVIWADGRGRAWFCKPHFASWKKAPKDEIPREIVRERQVPDGVVGEKFGEYPKKKTAKATGTKCGDGESVGLFIPLPKNLAKKFPSLGHDDTSPSHVTFLYIGDFKGSARQAELVDVLKDVCRRWWPACQAVLGDIDYFDHHDKDRRVPHVCVEFDKDLSGFRQRVKQELTDAGIEVGDSFPEYKPHVTLAYMPGMDAEWKGKIPKGSWDFDKMEVWGLPKVHRLQLGPSITKISEEWLRRNTHRRVAARHLIRKIAGWWAITPDNPGINCPPVDKGGLMNAIPGEDPAEASLYNGDGPADLMGDAMDDIDMEYLMSWGRPATKAELEAVFEFCMGPVRPDGSKDYGDHKPRNQWFIEFAHWLGKEPNDVRFFQMDSDIVDALRANWDGTGESLEAYKKDILDLLEKTQKFEGGLDANELAERLNARSQVIRDEQWRGETSATGDLPKVVIRAEPREAPL